MESIEKKDLFWVLWNMFKAFGFCRGAIYISVGVLAYLLASHYEFVIETKGIDRYIQYLGTSVCISFTAYSIIAGLEITKNKLAERADDGESPLRNLFAVFTCSICLHLVTIAALFIFDGTGNVDVWFFFVGMLSVCLISLVDVGLNFFTLHSFLKE